MKEEVIMTKQMKLGDVAVGKNFEVWDHTYTVLDSDDKGVFVLETDSVCNISFRDEEADYKVAPNDFRDSSVKAYLEGTYTEELVRAGAKTGEDILPMELDLKCTLGQHEYRVAKVYAGLLTLEQYGKYYDIIPRIDTTYWLATPWKTPSRSSDTESTNRVWYVYSDGDCNNWDYSYTYGVRPILTLSPSLLVSIECDRNDFSNPTSWQEYLKYVSNWAIDHASQACIISSPMNYYTWVDTRKDEIKDEKFC